MNKIILSIVFLSAILQTVSPKDYKISSPNGKISITVNVGKEIIWSACYDNKEIITSDRIAMMLSDGRILGVNEGVKKSINGSRNEIIKPVVAFKKSEIPDIYNFITVTFRSGWSLTFRVYDDGLAYRFETAAADSLTIKNEVSEIQFPEGSTSWFPSEKSFMSHNENLFLFTSLDTISDKNLASLPVLFRAGDVNVLVSESSIEDYPGMWLKGAGPCKLFGVWPPYPAEEKLSRDRDLYVTAVKDYIARTSGTRSFPWRTFVISPSDGGLLESTLVYRLGAPVRIQDTEWIKPGKVAWDWWNANNVYGVDFKAGINMETYKYYIDFASRNGLQYVILDEGWYKLGDILEVMPGLDIKALCEYGQSRNVGIILWVVWKTFADQMDKALDQYSEWGVKGVKVDFMQRDDQKMVNFYYEAARKTAEHHMLIDFHGSYKPDGMNRTYPNALTREGVKGLENNKWSLDITPKHDATLPFTRMVTGPMDFTPGSMVNKEKGDFRIVNTRPESQGTRVHQMALYVIFESPLQMLADSPSNYTKEQECTDFITKVPVVWDDIKILQAKIGDYLLLARRSGKDWFIGGITNWDQRDFEIDLSFLESGSYVMDVFQDGINADRFAQDYKHTTADVQPGVKMNIHMAPGGGWAARISSR
jgi:alpha-glucosidase